MKRNTVLGVMVMAATLVSTQAVYAAPATVRTPVNAIYSNTHGKLIKFSLRNDSSAPVKLMVGDKEMTLEPGKPVAVQLAEGQKIVAEETTATNKAGDVLATAFDGLNGATVSVR
jgi:hypothetical protein